MLQSAFLTTITGPYRPFGEHFRAALAITALRRGLRVSPEDERAILAGVRTLPAYADAPPALERLRSAGYRLPAPANPPTEGAGRPPPKPGPSGPLRKAAAAATGKP